MSVQPNPRTDLQNWYRLEIFPILQIDPVQHQLWLEALFQELDDPTITIGLGYWKIGEDHIG